MLRVVKIGEHVTMEIINRTPKRKFIIEIRLDEDEIKQLEEQLVKEALILRRQTPKINALIQRVCTSARSEDDEDEPEDDD